MSETNPTFHDTNVKFHQLSKICAKLHKGNQNKPNVITEDFIPFDDSVIVLDDFNNISNDPKSSIIEITDDSLCNELSSSRIGDVGVKNESSPMTQINTDNVADTLQNCSVIEILDESILNTEPVSKKCKKRRKRKLKCKETSEGGPLKKKNTSEDVILIDDDEEQPIPKKSLRKIKKKRKLYKCKQPTSKKNVIFPFIDKQGSSPMFLGSTNNLKNADVNSCNIHKIYGNNLINGGSVEKTGLRTIIIDGSNVAMGHSNGKFFSVKGLQICINYFLQRGHKVKAFVPHFRTKSGQCSNPKLLITLCDQGHVILTPSREINGKHIVSYDDRFIVQSAAELDAIIVSSDNFRDLIEENGELARVIEKRLLMPTWLDDILMFPADPLGKFGPNLDTFLRFP